MNRLRFLKFVGLTLGLQFLAFLAFCGFTAASGGVATTYLLCSLALAIASLIYSVKAVHLRIQDVMPGVDTALSNVLFWIVNLSTGGLLMLILMVIPTNTFRSSKTAS